MNFVPRVWSSWEEALRQHNIHVLKVHDFTCGWACGIVWGLSTGTWSYFLKFFLVTVMCNFPIAAATDNYHLHF